MVRLTEPKPGRLRSASEFLSALPHRFERSLAGEAVISLVVTLIVLIAVVWNLPGSPLKRSLTPQLAPIASASGLNQQWRMYSPEPVHRLEVVEARVKMADGEVRVWRWQRGDLVIGPFGWYHWQKLKEQVIRNPEVRPGLSNWAVRQVTAPGEHPVHVELAFLNTPLFAPGVNRRPEVEVETLYQRTLDGRP